MNHKRSAPSQCCVVYEVVIPTDHRFPCKVSSSNLKCLQTTGCFQECKTNLHSLHYQHRLKNLQKSIKNELTITTCPFVEYLCWEQRQQSKSGKHHHPAGSTCQNEMPKYSFLDVHRSSSKIPPDTRWLLMLFTMPALHRYTLRELFLWHMQLIGLSSRGVSCLTMNYTVSAPLKNRLQLTTRQLLGKLVPESSLLQWDHKVL